MDTPNLMRKIWPFANKIAQLRSWEEEIIGKREDALTYTISRR